MKARFALLFLLALPLAAQSPTPIMVWVPTAPSGACVSGLPLQVVAATGVIYACQSGTWAAAAGGSSGGTSSSVGTRLRVAASAAAVSNPYTNLPLNPAPAWVASTAYKAGQVVANGGQLFICYVGGTSAASGGPAGPSQLQITDNTVTWYWYGVQQVTTAAPGAPTVTELGTGTFPASITQFITIVSSPSQFYFQGGVPCTAFGGDSQIQSATLPSGGNLSCGNSTTMNYGVAWSFVTDAPKIVIRQGLTAYQVIVDGSYAFPGLQYVVNKGDNTGYTVIDFSTSGGRKPHTITLQGSTQGGVATPIWVGVDALSGVWAPTTQRIAGCVLGDSQTAGGNSFPIGPRDSWPIIMSQLLGWTEMRNAGIGGTGYINPGTAWPFISHITDVTQYGCDAIVVAGGENDTGYTAAQVTAAVVTLLQTIHAALPNAPIFVVGPIGYGGGPDAAHLAAENAISAGVTQAGYSNAFFIPSLTNVPIWFKGTGYITAPNGTGNQDVYIGSDTAHLDQYGQEYLARQMANAIRGKLNLIP